MTDNGQVGAGVRLGAALLLALLCASSATAEEPLRLRIVSFNVWGLRAPFSAQREARIERIGPAIAALKPDVVALQEVWVDADAARLRADLAGAGLTHARFEGQGLAGSGLLLASRFPLRDVRFQQFRIAGHPTHVWRGDWYARKGIITAVADTPLGPLTLADTHLHARYGSSYYEPLQVTQALEVRGAVGDRGALILAGDLNSTRDQLPFRIISRTARLSIPKTPDLRIDWVLGRSGDLSVRCLEERHVLVDPVPELGIPLSDHPAVLAVFELAPHPGEPAAVAGDVAEVEAAAEGELEGELASSRWREGLTLALAVAFLLGAVWLGRRGWRAEGRRRRAAWLLACAALGLATALCVALALLHEPHLRAGLAASQVDLQRY